MTLVRTYVSYWSEHKYDIGQNISMTGSEHKYDIGQNISMTGSEHKYDIGQNISMTLVRT